MARSQETTLGLVILAVILGVLLAASAGMAFMSGGMMGGGMIGGGGGSVNVGWLSSVVVLGIILIVVLVVLLSPRQHEPAQAYPPVAQSADLGVSSPQPLFPASGLTRSPPTRIQESEIVRHLGEDERRLYVLIREKGGEMLQSEIVASGSFSKAKVTRLLDKLENKDIVVRERHGMTNRIRLITMPPQAPLNR